MELGPDNIRVNALLPGMVAGPRVDQIIARKAESRGIPYEEMEREFLDTISLRRSVTAQDVADVAVFLASPAGRNISGQAIAVDGDMRSVP
jgi:NAD(P)-dependent dehydrogenase (short-subunit alcohol dehydrogenase family)